MEEKIKDSIEFYQTKLDRKERMVQPYQDKLNDDEKMTEVEYAQLKTYQAEISMLKRFIDDLKYIIE